MEFVLKDGPMFAEGILSRRNRPADVQRAILAEFLIFTSWWGFLASVDVAV
jgi:hypothetical protein